MIDHLYHFIFRVMDRHIDTGHGIVPARDRFQVGRVKLGVGNAQGGGPSCGFGRHGLGNIRRRNGGPHLCQWYREATDTTTTIANGFSRNVVVGLDPVNNLLYGLIMSVADV